LMTSMAALPWLKRRISRRN